MNTHPPRDRPEFLEARIAPAFLANFSLQGLSSHDGAKFLGQANGDEAGDAVSNAGDVNGDGYGDFLIAAPGNAASGTVYLIYGKAGTFTTPLNLSALTPAEGFPIFGAAGDAVGAGASGAGDVNGDGLADIVVGATGVNVNGNLSGAAFVVFGTRSQPTSVDLHSLDGTTGFQFLGEAASDRAGGFVAAAGDVNGDGFGDIVVGAEGANNFAGAAYVVFGHAGPFATLQDYSALTGFDGFKINGFTNSNAGSSVSGGGDVNGDGFADVVIGAPGADNSHGAAYVVLGHGGPFDQVNLLVPNAAVVIKLAGEKNGDSAGTGVGVGDINGDGLADVVVGAGLADSNGTNSGSAYVFFGKKGFSGAVIQLSGLSGDTGYVMRGATGDGAGMDVRGAGDVNGDGLADFLIGAPFNGSSAGVTYLVLGQKLGYVSGLNLPNLDGANGFKIFGESAGNSSGATVSSAGDVNGDGFADLLIGAPQFNQTTPGAAYLVYGSNGGYQVTIGPTLKTATYTDVDGDLVTIKTTKGSLTASDFTLSGTNDLGGATLRKIDLHGQSGFDFTDLSITAKPQLIGGTLHGDGLANIGNLEASGLHFGKVVINGDLGQFHFGAGGTKSAAKSFTVNSIGAAGLSTQGGVGASLGGFALGTLPSLTVKTSVHDALIGGNLFGKVRIGGGFVNSKLVLSGDPAATKAAQAVALKSFTTGGDFDHAQLLIGFSAFGGNADAGAGKIAIGGNWIESDLSAGVSAGSGGTFGDASDAAFAGGKAAIVSTIASITIKGQALGTFAPGGQFGITAQKIGAVKIGATKITLQKSAQDHFLALGSTGDFFLNEVA